MKRMHVKNMRRQIKKPSVKIGFRLAGEDESKGVTNTPEFKEGEQNTLMRRLKE